jgi:hypothetical protein
MIEYIVANWATIVAAITAVVSAASVIARLTPTQVDNQIIDKILSLIDVLALNNIGVVGTK